MSNKTPDEVHKARAFTKKTMLGITLASCAIVPFALFSKTLSDPQSFMNIAMAVWGAGLGLGALVFPWRKLSAAQSLVKEYDRMQAKAALGGIGVTENDVAQSHPLAPMIKRVRQLAADDQRMLDVLDTLVSRLDTLAEDLESLRAAIAVEEDLGAEPDELRMRRLMAVLQEKVLLLSHCQSYLLS